MATKYPIQGGCACGAIRYQLNRAPMATHVCYCTDCQRKTGTASSFGAIIETEKVTLLPTESGLSPVAVPIPSEASRGQNIFRCPACYIALWGQFGKFGPSLSSIRAGTLDTPAAVGSPTATIFTRSKMPWVRLPEDTNRVFEQSYKFKEVWDQESLGRLQALMPKVKEHQRETFGKELPFEE